MPASEQGPTDEATIRCRDLAAMVAFYRDIVGLEVVEDDSLETAVLMRSGEGFGAPERRVALVLAEDDDEPIATAHHLTLTVADARTIARAEAWFRANGLAPETAENTAIGWKCLTVRDPEGNAVEFAAPVRQRTPPPATRAE